ncbi:hypothetical protein [Clostridium thermobutyricum]|uniref:Uncharacterized protein n=1 Tax=Clostridium thermobutyricum DSM 4928 TaxID=1121339 RepID=A0A1V4SW91_9CLOT|nr:hypothetical protein [Clostridium thermobutyricum]OPX47836.1 hypothetical protein CLTHE_14070 [Clostridium thermobutyricum DSM 4928]
MDNKNLNVSCDSDFFTRFQCPYCNSEFKIENSFFINEEVVYNICCPYCGITNKIEEFMTEENLKEFQSELENMAIEVIEELFEKTLNNAFKGSKFITFEKKKNTFKKKKVDKAVTPDDMHEINIKCCDINIKIDSYRKEAFCIKCGESNE